MLEFHFGIFDFNQKLRTERAMQSRLETAKSVLDSGCFDPEFDLKSPHFLANIRLVDNQRSIDLCVSDSVSSTQRCALGERGHCELLAIVRQAELIREIAVWQSADCRLPTWNSNSEHRESRAQNTRLLEEWPFRLRVLGWCQFQCC